MDQPRSQSQDIKAEFARRKKKRGYTMLLMLALLVALVGLGEGNLSPIVAGVILVPIAILLIGAFVYVFRIWRCPACNRFLGATDTAFGPGRSLDSCPKCNAALI